MALTPGTKGTASEPATSQAPADASEDTPPAGRRRTRWRLIVSGSAIAAFVLAALVGPVILDYDPVTTHNADRLLPPGAQLSDGGTTVLGTDQLGRSVFAQIVEGSRVSLLVAAATIVLGGVVGLVIGICAGYFGGVTDTVAMRLADMQLGIPSILLAILIAGVLGPSVLNIIITLAITRWVLFARVVRGSALATKNREFVDSARVLGATPFHIITRYILPSCLTPLLIVATAQVGLMIIAEASLSFLGLGVPLDQASWGSIIANGRDYLGTSWWIATFPGLALVATVVSIGFLSDELRDWLDPSVNVDTSR
jgi:peptide/nickel transport system permease protein